jgi:SAM-dependent methyltransferase
MISPNEMNRSRKDFWGQAHRNFAAPHFRLQKSARLINKMAPSSHCTLLDVGCARAALQPLLKPNIEYFGIDIAIGEPAPNLHEVDILDSPIEFDGRQFDFVVALGLLEYLGGVQEEKFREIAQILSPRGHFILTYENFDHRQTSIYWAYTNVQSPAVFRASLEREFIIEREWPTSLNWRHSQPVRPLMRAVNMGLTRSIPVVTPKLAVEYFFMCSSRQAR